MVKKYLIVNEKRAPLTPPRPIHYPERAARMDTELKMPADAYLTYEDVLFLLGKAFAVEGMVDLLSRHDVQNIWRHRKLLIDGLEWVSEMAL